MAPKLKPLPRKSSFCPGVAPASGCEMSEELCVGNICVGAFGVKFAGEADLQVPLPNLSIDDLEEVRQLGQGTQGNVSMYKMVGSSTVFAVKKIPISFTVDSRTRQTVAAELRNIFVDKPNKYTVLLYNAFYRDGSLRMVMEYMDWGNLDELLCECTKVPESACAYIASQVLHALEILHTKSNIVTESGKHNCLRQIHRDVKPANVLLSMDGTVKLADFGIATSAETIGVNSFVGTATYMSPERIQGRRYSTPSDIWSVGVVIIQLLLGRYPFSSVNKGFMALLQEITTVTVQPLWETAGYSEEAQDFIDHCLCQNPDERFAASQLLQHPWIQEHAKEDKGRKALTKLLTTLGSTHCRESDPAFDK